MRYLGIFLAILALAPFALADDGAPEGECRYCGATTYGWRPELKTGNTTYKVVGYNPAPSLCPRCAVDVQSGRIDPKDPPTFAGSRDGEAAPRVRNPYAGAFEKQWELKEQERKEAFEGDPETDSGFGALPWVIGILGAMFFCLRWFMR